MRNVKLIIWICLIYIIQSSFGSCISIFGYVPDLMLAFAVMFSFRERDRLLSSVVLVICAILSGVLAERMFPAAVIITALAGAFANMAYDRMKYVPKWMRSVVLTGAAAMVMGTVQYFFAGMSFNLTAILKGIVPYAAYTFAASCVMYPVMARTMFMKQAKKLLIV